MKTAILNKRAGISLAVTICLLAGVAGERLFLRARAADAQPYHQQVRAAVNAVPFRVGDWYGTDCPVPPAAVTMLRPNIILSRRYQSIRSGKQITVLLVHCGDARDILGHYPPICYPGQGWAQLSAKPRNWQAGGMEIRGTQYVFASPKLDSARIAIDNFMVLPDGTTCRDMGGIDAAARDRQKRYFGAAQVQLVADAGMPESEREAFLRELLEGAPMLRDVIRHGANR